MTALTRSRGGAQNPDAGLGDASGNELRPGAVVRLGYFDLSIEEVAAAFHDVDLLETSFTEMSREEIGNFGGVVFEGRVETSPSNYDVSGAFAQTVTLEGDDVQPGKRFYIWAFQEGAADTGFDYQAIFSSSNWTITGEQVTVPQWGIGECGRIC